MAHYKQNFDLNVADIELIEDTIRNEIRALTDKKQSLNEGMPGDTVDMDLAIKRLNGLLGKLHNQKIWYSQVNQTGVPLG